MADDENFNDTEVLDEEPRSILLGLISQLRKGMDLHRVTLPTFVLEPRSMLERITDFMSHPDLILSVAKEEDPLTRFVSVVRYYLSGWHIKPKGVKKPYNPVLGEHFRARWVFPDNTEAFFVSEQVSHHPPISAYYYASPENNLIICGDIRPKSKFLGNSAATLMQGESKIYFTNRPGEVYQIVMPNVYARGILFGRMVMELGDNSTVRCENLDFICELEFRTKGFFTGAYNSIYGKIKQESTGEIIYEITGKCVQDSNIYPKIVAPDDKQEENESRRLWSKVTSALIGRNLDLASNEKSKIEDCQRDEAKLRESDGIDWRPRYFLHENNEYKFKYTHLSKDPAIAKQNIESIIFSTNPTVYQPHHHNQDG
ncbi:5237_t:CDS:2 [Diversispora eburnea]|uniref:5237_t:CDS:1 n=1 Tax=Diversispora eburnea TaxID=1213867 RepID=A0A9N9BCY0_9GLOM|nr:5237_t:CDS:2 [Diversispora eburnea]